jgi:riboflavin synthase
MFTGLVETIGRIVEVRDEPPGVRLTIVAGDVAADAPLTAPLTAPLGASVCVSGCCLSVVAVDGPRLSFQLGPETLARTSLGGLATGAGVNLERSLRLSDRLGGHLVTGHVDGVGRLLSRDESGDWVNCRFSAPAALLPRPAVHPHPRLGRAREACKAVARPASAQAPVAAPAQARLR